MSNTSTPPPPQSRELDIFHSTHGNAVAVTNDPTGANLPARPQGGWRHSKSETFTPGSKGRIGASDDEVIAAIDKDGYIIRTV